MNKTFLLLLCITFSSCTLKNSKNKEIDISNGKEVFDSKYIDTDTTNFFKSVLRTQVNRGSAYYYFTQYSENDFRASIYIIRSILEDNAYEFNSSFNEKIRSIFQITNKGDADYVCVSKYSGLVEKSNFRFDEEGRDQYIYIVFKENFITDFTLLPLLFDYRKYYPEIAKEGDIPKIDKYSDGTQEPRLLWKDFDNLEKMRKHNVKTIVHRNKYLFEDNQSSLEWLINHDFDFLKKLVTTFGYDKDSKINEALLKSTWVDYQDDNDYGEAVKVFAKKSKKGIDVRNGLFQYILESSTKENNDLAIMLNKCGFLLFCDLFDNDDVPLKLNKEDALKLLSYIGYYSQSIYEKLGITINESGGWSPHSCLVHSLLEDKRLNFLDHVKKNNYYNLPGFDVLIAEVVDTIIAELIQ